MDKIKLFIDRLVRVCPVLPYMAFALWQAWFFALVSGAVWVSDTEVNGSNISVLFMSVSGSMGIAMLLAAAAPFDVHKQATSDRWVFRGSVLTSIACAIIIAIGPYYLKPYLPEVSIYFLFVGSGIAAGVGMAPLLLRCGKLYSTLSPRRVILYVAGSHMVAALTYFVVMGSPSWALVPGGPSLCGILFFVLFPAISGLLAIFPVDSVSVASDAKEQELDGSGQAPLADLSKAFTKFVMVVFVFSVVLVSVHAVSVQQSSIADTLDSSRAVMLLRLLLAGLFVLSALSTRLEAVNLGKLYSFVMVIGVVTVALLPALGLSNVFIAQAAMLVTFVFEIILWCIAAFATYQKGYSPVAVFGWAYGAYLIGNCLGWALGAFELSALMGTPGEFVVYVAFAVVTLVFSFILYSEKEFDALFEPESEQEKPLQELLAEDIAAPQTVVSEAPVRKKFAELIDELAQEHGLSNRETDVFRCLAMGYDATATAERLGVSWNTVRTHTRNVYAKLDVHSKQELIDKVDAHRRESDAEAN